MADNTIETALYTILSNNAGVSALVVARIYPIQPPPNAVSPYVLYQQVSGASDVSFDGATGFARSTWQVSCWASTYVVALRVSEAVRKALNGYSGTPSVGAVTIRYCELVGKTDLQNLSADTTGANRFGKALTFEINFTEPTS
jgi:hypothetical protein